MRDAAKHFDPELGARNLLVDCVGVTAGDRVLIVSEAPGERHYDTQVPICVAKVARELGAEVSVVAAPLPDKVGELPCALAEEMNHCDHTVFLSRMADHARFVPISGHSSKTICYALDEGLLGSAYATLPHGLMSRLLRKLERELDQAKHWSITCPLGTDVQGTFVWQGAEDEDFTFDLFPVTTFKPVPCSTMSGKIALAHWLIPGGKACYEPAFLPIRKPVMAHVTHGRLERLVGDEDDVRPVQAHRDMVATKFGIDRDFVHSWHVGLNPHTFYSGRADDDLERWGAISFASPRYLHFHTCGDYAPGEIAWSVFDPTVSVDGVAFWKDGVFVWLEREDNAKLIAQYPGAECLYTMRRDVGVDF
ncbi:MAG: hypothetical protein HKN05_10375 [Rhizobiales bacterium]|nr:hypothetical protein [Hyphomicrobiales bacterium]